MDKPARRIIGVIRIVSSDTRADLSLARDDSTLGALLSALVLSPHGQRPNRWPPQRRFARAQALATVGADAGRLQEELEQEYERVVCR
jgi:hypothetical protein